MGSITSSPIIPVDFPSPSNRKKIAHIAALNRFAQTIYKELPKDSALGSVLGDKIALKFFVNFISKNEYLRRRSSELLAINTEGSPREFHVHLAMKLRDLSERMKIIRAEATAESQFLRELIYEFIESPFYVEWREFVVKVSTECLPKIDSPWEEITLPDLNAQVECSHSRKNRVTSTKLTQAQASVRSRIATDVIACEIESNNNFSSAESTTRTGIHDISNKNSQSSSHILSQAVSLTIDQQTLRSEIEYGYESCDQLELNNLCQLNSWLPYFISSVELLPISVTLSTVYDAMEKLPLIYVNRDFEKNSGVKRDVLIGRPGTFLQTRTTLSLPNQSLALDRIFNAVRRNVSVVTALTCSRGHDDHFTNLIAVKPIICPNNKRSQKKLDTKYNYRGMDGTRPSPRYVVTIQMDAKKFQKKSIEEGCMILQNIIALLPGEI